MNTQAWYSDKAVVSGILNAVLGLYLAIRSAMPSLPDIDPNVVGSIITILAGIGLFGTVTRPANTKIGLKTRRLK